jgi:hypothetical protein
MGQPVSRVRGNGSRGPREAIVEANLAVELPLHVEASGISKEERGRFTRSPYGDKCNMFLPTLLSMTKAPPIPGEINKAVNKLRDLRNDVARGSLPAPCLALVRPQPRRSVSLGLDEDRPPYSCWEQAKH